MMDNERAAVIALGGHEYNLVLTTKATKAIAKRYGGLEKLGDKLTQTENFEDALDEVIWLLTLLANQGILIHNLQESEKQPLLTEEAVELLTLPFELAEYKNSIMDAMYKGTKRHVESEDTSSKNAIVGQTTHQK